MVILILVGILLAFSMGRMTGHVEAAATLNAQIHQIIDAVKRVETLAALKGEDVSKLSTEDLIARTRKQMVVTNDTDS